MTSHQEYATPHDDDIPTRSNDLRAGIERRLTSLESHSIKQLEHCNGPVDLYADLVEGMRQDMTVIDSQLEDLSLLAEEAPTEQLRQSILQAADFLSARLSRSRVKAREETIKAKRRIDTANASSQREALFGSTRAKGVNNAPSVSTATTTSKDDELMNATANVTDGLRKTRQLLEQELERSSMSTQILERSSQTLTLTSDQYTSFSGLLNASKNLITTMQKADTLDRLLILAALLFFALVCVLIIKRRIIDRGIRAATLFTRIAGAGSAPLKKGILPSAVKVPSATLSSQSSAAKATMQEVKQSAGSVLSSVIATASAVTASATLAISSIASQHASSTTLSGQASPSQTQSMDDKVAEDTAGLSDQAAEETDVLSGLAPQDSIVVIAETKATTVPASRQTDLPDIDSLEEVTSEDAPSIPVLERQHVMDEL